MGTFEVVVEPQGVLQLQNAKQFLREHLGNGVTLDLIEIPGGTFLMGSPEDEPERQDNEGPQHEVTVPAFLMGRYPVTQAQWRAVAALPNINQGLSPNPSKFKGDDRPVEKVSWFDAVEFCGRLTNHTGKEYRLPSEAEWEYACRAGTTTPYSFGENLESTMANFNWGKQGTTDVGIYPANNFGLHDMHGNVSEWCQDCRHDNYKDAPTDGSVWLTGDDDYRVHRGGFWNGNPRFCRSAYRDNYTEPVSAHSCNGFRVSYSILRT